MNVLSLFDGISCGRIALERANIKVHTSVVHTSVVHTSVVNKYFASEIDKNCIKVTQHNYPDTIQVGDITKLKGSDLPKIDLMLGGFPCQSFSFAGKQLNFSDPRGKLFFELVRLLKECKPKYFLFENVVMKKEYQDVISNLLGVEPILINSALVSAQHRRRLYWTNIPNVSQPKDKEIYLKDILEPVVDEKYALNEKWLSWWIKNGEFQLSKKYSSLDADKAITLTARMYASWNGNFVTCVSKRGRHLVNGVRKDYKGAPTTQRLEPRIDGKTNCLSTVQKDNYVLIKKTEIDNNLLIRKLTPIECEKLQTIPPNYTSPISTHQRYKAIGNAWTVDVIAHILKAMPI